MFNAFIAIAVGATLGAWLRWGVSILLNQGLIPLGTLTVNLMGGFLMGLAMAYFFDVPNQNAWRLFITTGFLGGLTTFSAFSAEAFNLLYKQQYLWAFGHILSHVVGSLVMTALGFMLFQYLRH